MNRPIAVFDSGVGGLSTLAKLKSDLPKEDFLYFADNLNAPYGKKSKQEILNLTLKAIEGILAHNPKAIVIACNTVTGLCIETLRQTYPDVLFFGIQPAVKPAPKNTLVFVTTATAGCDNFRQVVENYGENKAYIFPLKDAAELIEKNTPDDEFTEYIKSETLGVDFSKFASIVLGCTHYVIKKDCFERATGLPAFDGNDGLSKHISQVLKEKNLFTERSVCGSVFFHLSNSETAEFQKYIAVFNGLQNGGK